MTKQTSPQHRAEPNEATLEFWRFEANMQRLHGVKPVILPGFGKHRAASIMAAPATHSIEDVAAAFGIDLDELRNEEAA